MARLFALRRPAVCRCAVRLARSLFVKTTSVVRILVFPTGVVAGSRKAKKGARSLDSRRSADTIPSELTELTETWPARLLPVGCAAPSDRERELTILSCLVSAARRLLTSASWLWCSALDTPRLRQLSQL